MDQIINRKVDPQLIAAVKTKQKKRRSISFAEGSTLRTWNESKSHKNGPFSLEETQTLKQAICAYALRNSLSENEVMSLITGSNEVKQAWTEIAECLPERSVYSIHHFARRKFNPNNYGGRWTQDEQMKLYECMKQGKKWKQLQKQFDRTGLNIRDKWRSMGQFDYMERNSGRWSLTQLIRYLKLLERYSNISFLKEGVQNLLEQEETHQKIDIQDYTASKRVSYTNHNYQILKHFIQVSLLKQVHSLDWQRIAKRMKTKSRDDCRNKLIFFLNGIVGEADELQNDLKMLLSIKSQKIQDEGEIEWSVIENERSEERNKIRWKTLKRRVSGRVQKSLQFVLKELQQKLKFKEKHYHYRRESGRENQLLVQMRKLRGGQ